MKSHQIEMQRAKNKKVNRGCFRAMGWAFIVVGSLLTVFITVMPLYQWAGSYLWWDKVDAAIMHFREEHNTGSSSQGRQSPSYYSISVHYKYVYDGNEFESRQFAIGEPHWSYPRVRSMLRAYENGAYRHAYVNPADPSESVLSRRYTIFWVYTFIGPGFLIVGLLCADLVPKSVIRRIKNSLQKYLKIRTAESVE